MQAFTLEGDLHSVQPITSIQACGLIMSELLIFKKNLEMQILYELSQFLDTNS